MRKILTILLLAFSLSAWGTKYYIDPAGVDDAGRNGSISQPWAKLSYACSRVTTAGDTIYVNAGSYSETAQCNLSVGVSITGAGRLLSIITASSSFTNFIYASSAAGTLGNQSISNITLDANLLVTYGVRIYGRSNFTVHDFGLRNTNDYGLTYADQSGRDVDTEPTTWATNNFIYNNYLINCGSDLWYLDSYWAASAAIDISGQDGMLIYDNNIDNATGGRYAYGIKGLIGGGYHKGVKIFNNIIRTNIRDNAGEQSFGFNIELWTGVGGIEIYNNDLNGAVDLGGRGFWDDYNYGYAAKVYNNKIVQPIRPTNDGESGLILESGSSGGCYFYNNRVENFSTGFTLGTTAESLVQGFDEVWINNNLFCNLGYTSGGKGAGISGYNLSTGVLINKLYIVNNTIHKVNSTGGHGVSFEYATANTWNDTHVRNNIIYNAYTPIQFRSQTLDSTFVTNNIVYGNTRAIDNSTSWEFSTYTNRVILDNQVGVNPLFISANNFALQSNSPAINAGIDVGLLSDYLGNPIIGLPDIGAFEYQGTGRLLLIIDDKIATINYKIPLIEH